MAEDVEQRWAAYYRGLILAKLTWRQLGEEIDWRRSALANGSRFTFKEREERLRPVPWPGASAGSTPLREAKSADDFRRLRAMMKDNSGFPRSHLAFAIGQAARPFLEISSGPVGLWASGHHRHLIGFLATLWSDEERSPSTRNLFLRFIWMPALLEDTVFDQHPYLAETYSLMENLDDEEAFEKFRSLMRPIVTPAREFTHIQRESARRDMVFNEDELRAFDAVWNAWSATPKPQPNWPIEFRIAYACCDVGFSFKERESILVATVFTNLMEREMNGGSK